MKNIEKLKKNLKEKKNDLLEIEDRSKWIKSKIRRIKQSKREVPIELKKVIIFLNKKEKVLLDEINSIEKKLTLNNQDFAKKIDSDFFQNQTIGHSSQRIIQKDLILEISNKLKKAGISQWVDISGLDDKIVIGFSLPVIFGSGKEELSPEYRHILDKMVTLIKPYDLIVEIKTFNPIKKKTEDTVNYMKVGINRAVKILDEMSKSGIPRSKFKIYNYTLNSKGEIPERSISIKFFVNPHNTKNSNRV